MWESRSITISPFQPMGLSSSSASRRGTRPSLTGRFTKGQAPARQVCHTGLVWLWRDSIRSSAPLSDHDSGAVFRVPGGVLNSGRFIRGGAMAQKLFIGGLSFSTSNERLREVFAQAGAVESATVVTDRDTGRSRGFGFVEMATAEEADAAVKKFNGQEVDGRTLKVERANAKTSGGGGARGGGFSRSRW